MLLHNLLPYYVSTRDLDGHTFLYIVTNKILLILLLLFCKNVIVYFKQVKLHLGLLGGDLARSDKRASLINPPRSEGGKKKEIDPEGEVPSVLSRRR